MAGEPMLTVYYESEYGIVPDEKSVGIDYNTWDRFILTEEYFPTLVAEGHTFLGWSYNGELIENKYLEILFEDEEEPVLIAIWDTAPTPKPQEKLILTSMSQLQKLADAIRAKDGSTDGMTIDEMPGKIELLKSGADYGPFTEVKCGTITTPSYTKELTIDNLSSAKLFIMRSVEGSHYSEYDHVTAVAIINSGTWQGFIAFCQVYQSMLLETTGYIGKPTISGDTMTFEYILGNNMEYEYLIAF